MVDYQHFMTVLLEMREILRKKARSPGNSFLGERASGER